MDPNRALRQQLEDYLRVGINHIEAGEYDLSMLTAAPQPVETQAEPQTESTQRSGNLHEQPDSQHHSTSHSLSHPASETTVPNTTIETKATPSSMPAMSKKDRIAALEATAQRVAACKKCEALASTRTQTVFGVGNPKATVMFIGEAPGADEDKQGEPFVGRAGKLLDKIIEACGWQRSDIYICNILRCRPPGNRNPTSVEAANCREYLDEQIRIVSPKYIVCWGTIAAQNLLDKTDAIGKLRQTFFVHGNAKVLCTYHPSYLLRNPAAKKPVWEDMQILLREMGIDPATLPSAQK